MTVLTTTSVLDQTSDVGFQAWGTEFNASLTAVGLTQTADTGQIDWTTVTRPGSGNTFAGYEIWRFNDTLQSTKPIFFKIHYGNFNAPNDPGMAISVSTSSDGAGNLNGPTISIEQACCYNGGPTSTITAAISRYCYNTTQGSLGVVWKYGINPASSGAPDQAFGGFMISRTNDNTGAPTGEGVVVIAGGSSTFGFPSTFANMQTINFTTGALNPPSSLATYGAIGWAPWPLGLASTVDGGDVSAVPALYAVPSMQASANLATVNLGEVALGSTAVLALVGSTTHTFLSVGRMFASTNGSTNNSTLAAVGALMLWE